MDSGLHWKTPSVSPVCVFGGVVAVSVLTQSSLLSLVMFSLLILWDERFIIPSMLISPAIETILVSTESVTITKLLAGVVVIYCCVHLFRWRRQRIGDYDRESLWLVGFLAITVVGAVNGEFPGGAYELRDRAFENLNTVARSLLWNIEAVFPKIVMALCLYEFLKLKGRFYFVESLHLSAVCISVAIIIITVHFAVTGSSDHTGDAVTRSSFQGTDPNEFSSMLSALCAFALYLLVRGQLRGAGLLGLAAIGAAGAAVSATVSRGGALCFIMLFGIFYVVCTGRDRRKVVRAGALAAVGVAIMMRADMVNVSGLFVRFFQRYNYDGQYISATSGRWELFGAACEAFLEKPVLGHGNSPYTSMMTMESRTGRFIAVHNLYLEILVRFGSVGFAMLSAILWRALRCLLLLRRAVPDRRPELLLSVPTIGLGVLLCAGLSLSWQWREMVWYFLGISLASSHFCREQLALGELDHEVGRSM
jgi:O-antigen ligase